MNYYMNYWSLVKPLFVKLYPVFEIVLEAVFRHLVNIVEELHFVLLADGARELIYVFVNNATSHLVLAMSQVLL